MITKILKLSDNAFKLFLDSEYIKHTLTSGQQIIINIEQMYIDFENEDVRVEVSYHDEECCPIGKLESFNDDNPIIKNVLEDYITKNMNRINSEFTEALKTKLVQFREYFNKDTYDLTVPK